MRLYILSTHYYYYGIIIEYMLILLINMYAN